MDNIFSPEPTTSITPRRAKNLCKVTDENMSPRRSPRILAKKGTNILEEMNTQEIIEMYKKENKSLAEYKELCSIQEKQANKVNKALTTLKKKQKELTEERDQLKNIVDNFKDIKVENTEKIIEVEKKNNSLRDALSALKDMKNLEDKYLTVNKSLEQYKILCEAHEQKISEYFTAFKRFNQEKLQSEMIVSKLEDQVKYFKNLCQSMEKERRILHNTIQELKGNIRVFCRVRPRIEKEMGKVLYSINYIDGSNLEIGRADGLNSVSCSGKVRGTKQKFSFDKVFPPTASQEDIFEELALLVQSALEGYNVCVFAYGQTGSGKTYTMEGGVEKELKGMIPRTVEHIFTQMKEFEMLGWEYRIEASFLEIYNEHIVDLLDFNQKSHEIRMVDSKGTDLCVTNLHIEEIHNPKELHDCLRIAQQNRAVAATKSNERSSRSHSVARIKLIGTHNEKGEMSIGNLNLVDLAGSERLRGEEAARTAETKNINKSLANLGNVILALLKKQDHVPYRNSKLTHLLMPSLGGNSKTLMLLTVSPLDECYNETLNSLRFASNVNSCKLGNINRAKTFIQNTKTAS